MCQSCDWQRFLDDCRSAMEEISEIPERGADFAASCEDRVGGMMTWAEDNEHVTEKMVTALENIRAGVARWAR